MPKCRLFISAITSEQCRLSIWVTSNVGRANCVATNVVTQPLELNTVGTQAGARETMLRMHLGHQQCEQTKNCVSSADTLHGLAQQYGHSNRCHMMLYLNLGHQQCGHKQNCIAIDMD